MKAMQASQPNAPPPTAEQNIDAIVVLEEEALNRRTFADRLSDMIAAFVGSIPFVVIHVVWFVVWTLINTGFLPRLKFDPYPYALLCMIVSLEGVLLSTFVLIKQNRMSQHADQRAHLDLQINLLAEKEITKVLQMQRLICQRLGIKEGDADAEVVELSEMTAVDTLAHHLEEKIPSL